RQQCLTCSRRAHQQNTLRNTCAQRVKLLGVLEELDDLDQLLLFLVSTRYIAEGDLSSVLHRFRLCLAEGVHLAAASAGLTHHEDPQHRHAAQQQQSRQQRRNQRLVLCRQIVSFEGGVACLF